MQDRGKNQEPQKRPFGYRAGRVTQMIQYHRQEDIGGGSTTKEEVFSTFRNPLKGIFLYPPSVIRKIIRFHQTDLGTLAIFLPHTEEYILSMEDFRQCLENYLPKLHKQILWDEVQGDFAILLALPAKKDLKKHSIEYFGFQYWGYLFHAEIHKQFKELEGKKKWNSLLLQEGMRKIGPVAFEEIRDVLKGENYLFNEHDDREVFLEFASYYLQLFYFHPQKLPLYFPLLKEKSREIRDLFAEIGLDEKDALKLSQPPHTPDLKDFEERRNSLRLQEAIANVFHLNYHIQKIIHHPLLWSHFKEEEDIQAFGQNYRPFLEILMGQILSEGRIMGELDFCTIRNLAIREEVDLERRELFLLDRILASHLAGLYRPSTIWQRVLLTLRSKHAIGKDRKNARRRKITENSTEKVADMIQRYKENPPSAGHHWRKSLKQGLFFFLAFGWLAYLFGKTFSLFSLVALRVDDFFLLWRFEKYYVKALWAEKKKSQIWAMMNLSRSQSVFGKIYLRYKLESAEKLSQTLRSEFLQYIQPVSEYFSQELHLDSSLLPKLQEMLEYLVHKTSLGGTGIEGDLLIDIENSRIDGNRAFGELNLMKWILSFGKKPLNRSLPYQEQMRRLGHLRSALKKSQYLRLPKEKLQDYQKIIHQACRHAENMIRTALKPYIKKTFENQYPELKDPREKIALLKIQEELLDVILEKGHSNFMDLRDVMSRNQLKLEDLKIGELWTGDHLIRMDQKLSRRLRGIHQKAPIYLRVLQKISSIFFGVPLGRWLSKYLLIPFGCALIFLVIGKSIIQHLSHKLDFNPFDGLTLAITSVVLGLLIHSSLFRKLSYWILFFAYQPLRPFLYLNRRYGWIRSWLLYPLVGGGILYGIGYLYFWKGICLYRPPKIGWLYFHLLVYGIFVIITFTIFNTRMGVKLRSILGEAYAMLVQAVGKGLLMAIVSFTILCSQIFMKKMEHLIYVVSDYLRFIQGEKSRTSFAKGLVFLVWIPFSYILSLYILLFLEPQINPLKFPMVSVFYKIMLVKPELYSQLTSGLITGASLVLPQTIAEGLAVFTSFFFTGIFGFLAWELKENWKLYKHNASNLIKPVVVGSHGETIAKFLRLGFHSGTIPRLFRKLREVTAQAEISKLDYSPVLPLLEERHHIEERLAQFAQRDFLLMLKHHPLFEKDFQTEVLEVGITSNTIALVVQIQKEETKWQFRILFEEKKGHLVSNFLLQQGKLDKFSPGQIRVLSFLLAVFYKKAGVDLVEEDLQSLLLQTYPHHNFNEGDPHQMYYHVDPEFLVVTFKASPDRDSDSTFSRVRRRLGLSYFRKHSNQVSIALDKIKFQRYSLEWKSFLALYEKGETSLGDPYLFLLDKEGSLSLPVEKLDEPLAREGEEDNSPMEESNEASDSTTDQGEEKS